MTISEYTILLVDDEKNTLKVLSAVLKQEGYNILTSLTGEEAWEALKNNTVHALVVDLKLPGMSGMELLKAAKTCCSDIPVIMITAYGTISNAVEAMKIGAYSYLTKPVNPDELSVQLHNALEKSNLLRENVELRKQLQERFSRGNIVGKSKPMQEIFKLVDKVSQYNSNVLITGETGTGKELIAKAIHYSGKFRERPFVIIDCAAIPETLLESEMFGHTKGAFTGASQEKKGQIELAEGGTLFLDEVGELPIKLQKKFLRFLQEKEFVRVGGTQKRKVNVRIIAATNKNLEKEIEEDNWREDLFYRLNVITIEIPPLRDRKEDLLLLVNFFLDKYNTQNDKYIKGVSQEVMDIFTKYDWPGNVRELENVIERAVVLNSEETISSSLLPQKMVELEAKKKEPNDLNLLEMEKNIICKALYQSDWNQSAAARILGISRKQLRTKMSHHGLLD